MQSGLPSELQAKLHVGIIMDGNGRWAIRQRLSRLRGHEAGVEAIRRVVEAAPKQGVGTLTLYAFSSDNWRRPKAEVSALMSLLRFYLANEVESLVRNGVRLTVIGRRDRLPAGIADAIGRAEAATRARRDLASAHRGRLFRARRDPQRRGQGRKPRRSHPREFFRPRHRRSRPARRRPRHPHQRREAPVRLPVVGERLCRAAFHEKMWPDFGPADLGEALASFHGRERRFGGLQPEVLEPKGEPALSV